MYKEQPGFRFIKQTKEVTAWSYHIYNIVSFK